MVSTASCYQTHFSLDIIRCFLRSTTSSTTNAIATTTSIPSMIAPTIDATISLRIDSSISLGEGLVVFGGGFELETACVCIHNYNH